MTTRGLASPSDDKRYVRRDEHGLIRESDQVGRSLSQDRRKRVTTPVKPGQGDRGDQRRHWPP